MQDRYSLTPFRMRAVRVLALVFLALGLHRTATLALPLVAPAYMVMSLDFDAAHWRIGPDPLSILPPEARLQVAPDAAARARYAARLADAGVRHRLFLIELLGRLPELAVMYGVGIALWRASRPGADAGLSGVPWLLRAAGAGVMLALVTPVAEAARTGLLLAGVVPTPALNFKIDLDRVEQHLLFAAAAWAATWTIASGLRARADLADIV